MKKMSLLAAAALMSTFLVACEGKKEKPAEETKAPEVTEQAQKPTEETKEVAKEETPTEAPKTEETPAETAPSEEVEKKVEQKTEELKEEVQTAAGKVEEKAKEVVKEAKEKVEEKTLAEETKEAPQVIEETKPQPPAQKIDGRKLFSSKGCTVCHKEKLDTVGPSLSKISAKYNGDKDSLIKFLRGKHPAIVDPARYTMMKPQISITKQMSDAELNALADYILSIK